MSHSASLASVQVAFDQREIAIPHVIYLVACRVFVLHFAFQHDATSLKTPVRVVRETCCCKVCWRFQFVKHQVRVQVAQG